MAKVSTQYVCKECQSVHGRWSGKCTNCGTWDSLEETAKASSPKKTTLMGFEARSPQRTTEKLSPTSLAARTAPPPRVTTGHPELDRVLGGGLVEGSAVLIGGSPGIGKSTLLLQVAARMAAKGEVHYFSGEESLDQIQLRAARLEVDQAPVSLFSTNDCLAIADHIETLPRGSIAIVDSVQTLYSGGDSSPGSVTQVKAAAGHLIPAAKSHGITLILVSHVTKEGSLAGPNVLMHAVDATLYIDTDMAAGLYRIVRSEKNRYGPADETGIFEMTERGMMDVENPSVVFIAQRDESAFGTVIFPSLEGTRPVLLEVQALVSPSAFGTGRRACTGWDSSRLNMLLATIGARFGLSFADSDVYVNVAGGMKVTDPAMDLAVAAAILSARAQASLPPNLAVFGEVGLAGEVRSSMRAETRIREAVRLGMTNIICPRNREGSRLPSGANITEVKRAAELVIATPDLKELYAA